MSIDPTSLFARIGGATAIERLVDMFYDTMENEPEARHIRAMHPLDLSLTRWVLKHYLLELTGGPKAFSPKGSRPGLRERHEHFRITAREKDAWLLCMHRAMDAVVTDEEARKELARRLTGMANWMINSAVPDPADTSSTEIKT